MTRRMLVAGAKGFVGTALVRALAREGHHVRACSRSISRADSPEGVEARRCDLLDPRTLTGVFDGIECAWYLVHSMGSGRQDYGEMEERSARNFLEGAQKAGVRRIVYLGGVGASRRPSAHLASRQNVGELLRSGKVETIELRAAMIVGPGSVSWQIVRDLSLRLPAMVMPRWLESRTRPVALEDVVVALVRAADVKLDGSAWFDIPGPEELTGRQILERVAALRGRRIPALRVPLLTPRLSSLWLRLVTRADYKIARELVLGLTEDLLPSDDRYWELAGHTALLSFDEAASRALKAERPARTAAGVLGLMEEYAVNRFGPRLRPSRHSP